MHKERKSIYQPLEKPKPWWASISTIQWMKLALFHLVLVALLGFLMRLKMIFPIPGLNQKFLLHAHSHFAFTGWVTLALMVLTTRFIIHEKRAGELPQRYQSIFWINLLAAYGMLLSFLFQGYDTLSISFSTLSVAASYVFAWMGWKDLHSASDKNPAHPWLRAALIFMVVSSVGTFWLAWIMTNNLQNARAQLAAIYFFLHFQYNGWFFFACMALFLSWVHKLAPPKTYSPLIFKCFVFACPLGYLLSILWWKMPSWLYLLLVITVIGQTMAWALWVRRTWYLRPWFRPYWTPLVQGIFACVLLAATIKFLLQGFSVIPALSKLSYSFRPIVIGYIHLVLLGIVTLFILAFAILNNYYRASRVFRLFSFMFILGVIANELILMLQGISGILRTPIAHLPESLAIAAGLMLGSLLVLFCSQIFHFGSSESEPTPYAPKATCINRSAPFR